MGAERDLERGAGSQRNGGRSADVTIGGIEKGMVDEVLDRAIERESRWFRLTEGQRKALGLKPSR